MGLSTDYIEGILFELGSDTMTPQREQYLAKCSKKELNLRACIADVKIEIRKLKHVLNDTRRYSNDFWLILIRYEKIKLNAYRQKLNRLTGWQCRNQ